MMEMATAAAAATTVARERKSDASGHCRQRTVLTKIFTIRVSQEKLKRRLVPLYDLLTLFVRGFAVCKQGMTILPIEA